MDDKVERWLADHPDAMVGAVTDVGAPTAMPAKVPLGSGHQIDDRSLLELVVPADTKAVTDAFIDALRAGVGTAKVHMASSPDTVLLLQYFDVRPACGVVLRVITGADGAEEIAARPVRAKELVPTRPRLGVVTKNELGTIVAVDTATTLMLGWGSDDLVGHSSLEFIHPDDHVRAIDNWMSRLAADHAHTTQTARLRYLCRDGAWLWLDTSNDFQVSDDGATVVVCQMIDVSDEMAAIEALRHNEQFLRRMADTVPVGIFHIAVDGTVAFVNSVLHEQLGDAPAVEQADLCRAMLHGDWGLLDAAISTVMADGLDSDLDVAITRPAGRPPSQCRVTLRAVNDEDAVIGVLGCVVDVTELKVMAETDGLTGLRNRRSIVDIVGAEIAANHSRVSVIFVDLDGFKAVNDSFGHRVGDDVLAAVSARLRSALRPGDHIGRLGGDEFLVVCPGVASPSVAMSVAVRLQHALSEHAFELPEGEALVEASMGVACCRPGVGADELVAMADAAMYRAKHSGAREPTLA